MTKERRVIVERVRKEGRQAYLEGKSRYTCPYKFMDEYQWLRGYSDAEWEMSTPDEPGHTNQATSKQ